MDELNNDNIPTLYEWMGGMPAIEKLTDEFYKKVHADALLEPVFKHAPKQHHLHVAHFIAEVFGGPKLYSEGDSGSHAGMIQKHLQKHLTEQHRRQWVNLLVQTADETGIPTDPEFRSAFMAYIEWGSRIAVITSNQQSNDMPANEPMPRWGWGVPGKPYQP